MQSSWFDTTIGAQATLQRGIDITRAEQRPGSVPVVSSGGISSYHDTAQVRGPGVVLGRKGVVGSVYYVEGDYWPHDTTLWVKDFHGNEPRFVYYFFRSIVSRLAALDVGSANPTLNRNHVHPIPTTWPVLSVQKRIADILAMLDDRIDLLRQTNATLESIAQALFKSWFIDFNPVRAKAEGREPEGMDAETAALFPDSFEDSTFGAIPRGWTPGRFGDLAELAKGSVSPLTASKEIFEHYSLPAFDAGQLPIFERGEAIKSNKTRVPPGAVLQSKLNPHIPRVWLPSCIGERAICSTEFLPWVAREAASSELVYCTLIGPSFEASVRTLVTGTSNSHQRVRPDQVAALELVVAPKSVSEAFTLVVRPLLRKVGENRLLSKTLAGLRDSLLPRLLSGKLRLPEMEARLNEALA
ncbi:restriction endonuclease subunit S [Trinickia sp.]|uniref:restriction endonuclease subunit S n=1 Tax=Trinickia sp. TaxID=2571163 RepID=UPI003F815364